MNERELLVDCLRRLNRSGVYYLIRSMASNYWGIPRSTRLVFRSTTADLVRADDRARIQRSILH
jgi:hypothetical protein